MAGKNTDIMAPDGYLLGGERLVRKGGVILFQRGWWQLPDGFAQDGEYCWVHEAGPASDLEVAPPGYRNFFKAQMDLKTIFAPRTDRRDAKPGIRAKWRKDWMARQEAALKSTAAKEGDQ